MNKRRLYLVPMVQVMCVHQENLMNNPTSWQTEDGKLDIIEGNPDETDYYAKQGNLSVWDVNDYDD